MRDLKEATYRKRGGKVLLFENQVDRQGRFLREDDTIVELNENGEEISTMQPSNQKKVTSTKAKSNMSFRSPEPAMRDGSRLLRQSCSNAIDFSKCLSRDRSPSSKMPGFMQYSGNYQQLHAMTDKTFKMNRHLEDRNLGLPADHGTKFNAQSLSHESKLKFRKVLKNR